MFRTLIAATALSALLTLGAVAQDQNAQDQNTQAPIDRSQLTSTTLTQDQLVGIEAFGPNGEHLGIVTATVLAADGKTVDALVIDFGGYLGTEKKQIAVAFKALQYFTDHNGKPYVFVNVTKDVLMQAKDYDQSTFTTDRQTQLLVPKTPETK